MAARREVLRNDKKAEPLLIFYDSEAANGNVHYGDVIEIAATCHPGKVVGSFESFADTKQPLCSFAIHESRITKEDLKCKPTIDRVVDNFLEWIKEMVKLANEKNKSSYFPVLCAHGGYQFDFLILFSNLERKGFPYKKFTQNNIHFADTFLFCKELQDGGNPLLQNTRLSIDGLFYTFFPKHTIKGRHRAMGDVKAMIKIFTQTSLKDLLHLISISTTQERIDYYISQSSKKVQQRILEEKMSSLDACSRNMYSKTLIKEGMTYDVLKTVFQRCSSFMEFWKVLKDVGIERKVAKHFTNQFGALGLQNEGALGYCLDLAKQNGTAVSNGFDSQEYDHSDSSTVNTGLTSTESLKTSQEPSVVQEDNQTSCNVDSLVRSVSSSKAFEQRPMDYALTSASQEARPMSCDANGHEKTSNGNNNSTISAADANREASNSEESCKENGSENWDSEISNSADHSGKFVLKIDDVIPVSIGIGDFSSEDPHSKISQRIREKDRKEKSRVRNPPNIRNNIGKADKSWSNSIKNVNEMSGKTPRERVPSSFQATNVETTMQNLFNADDIAARVSSEARKDERKTNSSQFNILDDETNKCEGNHVTSMESNTRNINHENVIAARPHLENLKTHKKASKGRNQNSKNRNKKKESKHKQNQYNAKQEKSVIFVDSPGSPNHEGKDVMAFFVGDVEIRVPVDKRDQENAIQHDTKLDIETEKFTGGMSWRDNECDTKSPKLHSVHDHSKLQGNFANAPLEKEDMTADNKKEKTNPEEKEETSSFVQSKENNEKETDCGEDPSPTSNLKSDAMPFSPMDGTIKPSEDRCNVNITENACKETEGVTQSIESMTNEEAHTDIDAVQACHDNYPNMYSLQPMPYSYNLPGLPSVSPTGLPPVHQAGYGFYPPMNPMIPVYPRTPLMPFPGLPFPGHQGFMPYGSYQHSYPIPGHVFQQPTVYHPQQELEDPSINPGEHEFVHQQNESRNSPDTLGIPCTDGRDGSAVTTTVSNTLHAYDYSSTSSDEVSMYIKSHSSEIASFSDPSLDEQRSSRRGKKEYDYGRSHPKENSKRSREARKGRINREYEKCEPSLTRREFSSAYSSSGNAATASSHLEKPCSSSDQERNLPEKGYPSQPPKQTSEGDISLATDTKTSEKPAKEFRESGKRQTSPKKHSSSTKNLSNKTNMESHTLKNDQSENASSSGISSKTSPQTSPQRSSSRTFNKTNMESHYLKNDQSDNASSSEISSKTSPQTSPQRSSSRTSSSTEVSPKSGPQQKASPRNKEASPRGKEKKGSPKSSPKVHEKPDDDEAMAQRKETNSDPQVRHTRTSPLNQTSRAPIKNDKFHSRKQAQSSSKHNDNDSPSRNEASSKSNDSGNPGKCFDDPKKMTDVKKSAASEQPTTESISVKSDSRSERKQHPLSNRPSHVASKSSTRQASSGKSSEIQDEGHLENNISNQKSSEKSSKKSRRSESRSSKDNSPSAKENEKGSQASSLREKKELANNEKCSKEASVKAIPLKKESDTCLQAKKPSEAPGSQSTTNGNKDVEVEDTSSSVPNQSSEAARKIKWPLSAWSGGSIKIPPKPQRDSLARRRVHNAKSSSTLDGISKTKSSDISYSSKEKQNVTDVSEIRHETCGKVEKSHENASVSSRVGLESNRSTKNETNGSVEARNNNVIASESKSTDVSKEQNHRTFNYRDILIGKPKSKSLSNPNSNTAEGSPRNGFKYCENNEKRKIKSSEPNNNHNDVNRVTKTSVNSASQCDFKSKDKKTTDKFNGRDTKPSRSSKQQSNR